MQPAQAKIPKLTYLCSCRECSDQPLFSPCVLLSAWQLSRRGIVDLSCSSCVCSHTNPSCSSWCVQACKLPYLQGSQQQLLRLADDKTLRDGLTTFPFSVDAEEAFPEHLRPGESEVDEP